MLKTAPFRFYIDTGGTFTDCLAEDGAGNIVRCKVLSSSSVRGTIKKNNQNRLQIETGFLFPDRFFDGYRFNVLTQENQPCLISGTFSSCSEVIVDGNLPIFKAGTPFEILSPEEAPLLAIRLITQTPLRDELPPLSLRLSTTKGTNALLERQGGKTLFFITGGFRDLLRIRNQQRPDLFSLNIQKPDPFYSHIIEVDERLDAKGNVLKKPDLNILREQIEPHLPGIEAAGICLMHSYLNPKHEKQIEKMLHESGVPFVSRSSALSASIKIVPRAITTDVDAYLTPVIQRYLNRISDVIGDATLQIMNSAGSLAEARHYSPKDGLFSGPAGGVIGAAAVAKRAFAKNLQGFYSKNRDSHKSASRLKGNPGGLEERGFQKIISFDMGGTSTDVARYAGEMDYIFEHTVGDATLSAPAIEIETVAAGGGSICGFDGKSLTVGPESGGADPGPACYGRGGPLTITDVNLLSGRLHPSNFPITITTQAARDALDKLMDKINKNRPDPLTKEAVLEGFLDIANERMAQTIRKISIQKGFDPAEYALVAFGGAGAQHALAVAEKLNISTVLVPSDAGLLSAYGLHQAKIEKIAARQVLKTLDTTRPYLYNMFEEIEQEAIEGLKKQGIARDQIQITRKQLYLRLKGQDSSLEIDWGGTEKVALRFEQAYRQQYGHWVEGREIEIEAIRVIASETKTDTTPASPEPAPEKFRAASEETSTILYNQSWHSAPVFHSDKIAPEATIAGPALVLDPHSTTVIEPGWEGTLLDNGTLVIQNLQGFQKPGGLETTNRPEAVQLQLYTNRFRSVADQMGEMLRKTALSVNIKERLDYSCALLDADGYLVVNAPHIPVHLGAMGTCVRTLMLSIENGTLQEFQILGRLKLEEGDILITNHPGYGGSHLPDVTVVTPVFYEGNRIGFVASRAHHAEIGGKRPGSMPPDAACLAEEGVVIPPSYLARKGEFDWRGIRSLLQSGPWPSRSVEENVADIQAAVAANHRGAAELKILATTFGADQVKRYMQRLKSYASSRMKQTLKKITDGTYSAEEKMDDGSVLHVTCTVTGESMQIDFSGTSGVHPGNLNANPSIVNSVIMYVLRLMVNEPLPLNDGLLEPVEVIIPEGMLNPPFPVDPDKCPAVVGGNIETSQRLADTLLKAFGLAACSYGTMNNVLFGNENFGYYETVAGGTGAGDGFHGADAVHQHMTNTRAADPEILEHRYPVRLNKYAIRQGSGGDGKWMGGNGIIREITFLEPVSLSVLTQHREVSPYGLHGGGDGTCGKQHVFKKNGTTKTLLWNDGEELTNGDRFRLETPGGGGWGKKKH